MSIGEENQLAITSQSEYQKTFIMKKLFLLVLISLPGLMMTQQVQQPNKWTKDNYLRKSKNQNALGVVMVSGGGLLATIGLIMSMSDLGNSLDFDSSNDNPQKEKTANALLYTGGGMLLLSVPVFLSSIKNKQRAAAISINSSSQPVLYQNGITTNRMPVLSFTISL